MSQVKRLVAMAVFLAAVATGCSNNDRPQAATTTTTTAITRSPSACDFMAGDRIAVTDVRRSDTHGEPCVREFLCADGRIHVEARVGSQDFAQLDQSGDWKGLEGFLPADQSGKPRPDTNDTVWQERGPEYDGTGRTKLQFDCGG